MAGRMHRSTHPIVREIRAARIARKLSYEKMGALCGYTGTHIWSIEHGKQGAKIEILADLAQALGLELVIKELKGD